MQTAVIALLLFGLAAAAWWMFRGAARRRRTAEVPDAWDRQLAANVHWYRRIPAARRLAFRQNMAEFLAEVRVEGVGGVQVAELDRLYVAAAAAVLRFGRPDAAGYGITEVVLQPGDFEDVVTETLDGTVGLVDHPDYHTTMILSQPDLRACFAREEEGNVAVHEFAHLVDRAGGEVDGMPAARLTDVQLRRYARVREREMRMAAQGLSVLDDYAADDEAEFFAVASEYFVTDYEDLARAHPRLAASLREVYGDPWR